MLVFGCGVCRRCAEWARGWTTVHEDRARNIFVGHLAFSVTAHDLHELFAPYGVVERIHLMTDRETGRPRGFGVVEMADDQAAQAAIAGLQGTERAGRPLHMNEARQRDERRPPPGGPRGGGGGRRWERSCGLHRRVRCAHTASEPRGRCQARSTWRCLAPRAPSTP